MLTVSGKTIGSKKPLFADFGVEIPEIASGGTTLRDLIDAVVRHEVAAFQQRQRDRQFIRVLTEREISAGKKSGKIESGGSEIMPQEVDVEAAVESALLAFEDGIYLVAIDDEQIRELDQVLQLQPESRVTFVRLTLLAGG
jgi:hypothetical protein